MATEFGKWQSMATAPKDGSRILVALHGSEQWPAEVEMVRWGVPPHEADPCWYAADGGANSRVVFSEGEVAAWMPLPAPPG